MKYLLSDFNEFNKAIQNEELVFLFGAGISSSLTGKVYNWKTWIEDGISGIKDNNYAEKLRVELNNDSSTNNLISVVGKVIKATKSDGSYPLWMHNAFEVNQITNKELSNTLKKLMLSQVVFATTNYDLLLEKAAEIGSLSYADPDFAYDMLDKHLSNHVLHLHGIYDSSRDIDNIVADKEQYSMVMENQGAQFIQNILGTKTLVFVGCGKTTEDANISRFIEFANKHLKMNKTYYYLCKEYVEGLPEHIVQIQYGDTYDDLPLFLEDIAQSRLRKKISDSRLVGYNVFDDHISSDDLYRYHFSNRSIPFCGRNKELTDLQSFITNNSIFSWWAITGQAGSGKSRLAFELLYRLPVAWFGFFINDDALRSDVNEFIPFSNTLVIIDYVAGRERYVAETINEFRNQFLHTYYNLRILLIERDNNRTAGTWYSKLLQRLNKNDAEYIRNAEYGEGFLYLEDPERSDVELFIYEIGKYKGVDIVSTSELYEDYGRKFERLKYRPLYVKLYVEAWIGNGCLYPQYDSYVQLLESLLIREQERWVDSVDRNQNVCNAFIRLMIRANISGRIEIDKLPDLYKEDWNTIRNYISSHSFAGKQKRELQDTLVNSFCQNIDNEHALIAPQFPDIIKEYMFEYYTDEEDLPDMMKEIWQHSAADFSVFIKRCMMDFPEREFYTNAINAYRIGTKDIDVLIGRLQMLKPRLIQRGENPHAYWDVIDNEYGFWSNITIPDDSEDSEKLAIIKVTGLYRTAEHFGAWSLYDLSNMEEVIDEMLAVKGGEAVNTVKEMFLQEHLKELSMKGFVDEAEVIRRKLDMLIGNGDSEYASLIRMSNANDEIMTHLFLGELKEAQKVLLRMANECNYSELSSVQILAHSCFNIGHISLLSRQYDYMEADNDIVLKCWMLYPEDKSINARRIACETILCEKKRIKKEIEESEYEEKINYLEKELDQMTFDNTKSDEALDVTWSLLKVFKLNFADEVEIRKIINEADNILSNNKRLSCVAETKIMAVRILHESFLKNKVTHEEVEDLYELAEANYDSESVRKEFFEMLNYSVDKDYKYNYFNKDIVREAITDARYNPMWDSGITEIDDIFDPFIEDTQPYIRKRKHPKIGANEQCPCGSGRKFKKCCRGKGIYD